MQGKIFSVRRVQLDIHDTLKMPLPYQYFHIMNLMLLVNLSVMAISVATFQSRVGSVAFGFMLLIFLGIREMSTGMADAVSKNGSLFLRHAFFDLPVNLPWRPSICPPAFAPASVDPCPRRRLRDAGAD